MKEPWRESEDYCNTPHFMAKFAYICGVAPTGGDLKISMKV